MHRGSSETVKFGGRKKCKRYFIFINKRSGENGGCILLEYDSASVDIDISGERCHPEGSTGPREITFFIVFYEGEFSATSTGKYVNILNGQTIAVSNILLLNYRRSCYKAFTTHLLGNKHTYLNSQQRNV